MHDGGFWRRPGFRGGCQNRYNTGIKSESPTTYEFSDQ